MIDGAVSSTPSESARSLRWNGSLAFASSSSRVIATVASIPILVRSLGLVGYGRWSVLVAITNLSALAALGLPGATSYFVAVSAARQGSGLSRLVRRTGLAATALGLAYAATIVAMAQPLSRLLLGSSGTESGHLLVLAAAVAFLNVLRQWLVGIESGLERWGFAAGLEAAISVGTLAAAAASAAVWKSVTAVAVATLIASLLGLAIQANAVRTAVASFAIARVLEKDLAHFPVWRFGLRLWVGQLGGLLFGQFDRIVVAAYLGPATAGLYSLTSAVGGRVNEVSAAAVSVLAPAITRARTQGDHELARKRFMSAVVATNFLVLILAGALLALTPLLALLLAGTSASTLTGLLLVVLPAYAIFSLNAPGHFAAQATGQPLMAARWVLAAGVAFAAAMLGALSADLGIVVAASANYAFGLTLVINFRSGAILGVSQRWLAVEAAKFAFGLATVALVCHYLSSSRQHPGWSAFGGLSALALIVLVLHGRLLVGWIQRLITVARSQHLVKGRL